jgi:hypothetical protein
MGDKKNWRIKLKIIFNLKYFFKIKKLQLKEHGLNLKIKENEGLL